MRNCEIKTGVKKTPVAVCMYSCMLYAVAVCMYIRPRWQKSNDCGCHTVTSTKNMDADNTQQRVEKTCKGSTSTKNTTKGCKKWVLVSVL